MSTKKPVNPFTLCAMGTDGNLYPVLLDPSTQSLKVDATLNTGDIEIGAVELKDGGSDQRAAVDVHGALSAILRDATGAAITDLATQTSLAALVAANHSDLTALLTALGTNHTDEQQLHTDLTTTILNKLGAVVLAAGAAIIGKVGIDQTTPGTTNAVVAGAAAVSGGIPSTATLASSAASTNATNVKTSAGRVYSVQGYNTAAYAVHRVLYDSALSPPVPGTTGYRKKIAIPAGAAFALDWPVGLSFANGIGFAFVKNAAANDATAIASGDITDFNLDYA